MTYTTVSSVGDVKLVAYYKWLKTTGQFIVVTGGTLARMKVKEARPKAIVAIACERDLASGMADVFPIPVIGVLNERPNGPCCNTTVDSERVRAVVEQLIGRNSNDRGKD